MREGARNLGWWNRRCRLLSDRTGYDRWGLDCPVMEAQKYPDLDGPGSCILQSGAGINAPRQGNTARDRSDVRRRHLYGCSGSNSPSGCLLSVLMGSWPGRSAHPDRSVAIRVHARHDSDSRGPQYVCQPLCGPIFDNRSKCPLPGCQEGDDHLQKRQDRSQLRAWPEREDDRATPAGPAEPTRCRGGSVAFRGAGRAPRG
jgi:hypothetical protein